jgi:Copper binding proteins, plastocyanin/azurin family
MNHTTTFPTSPTTAPWRGGRRALLFLPILGFAVACGVGLSVRTAKGPTRELTLVARDMKFYLAGDPTPNPRLVLRQGELVRVTLQNDDPGMAHDFAVQGAGRLDRASRMIDAGDSDRIEFTVPKVSGEYDYLCSSHPQMMRGIVEVR